MNAEPERTSNAGVYIGERWCGGHVERRDWSASLTNNYSSSPGAGYVIRVRRAFDTERKMAIGTRR